MSSPYRKSRITLMPLIALGALSLAVTVPTISTAQLHAAAPTQYDLVTVQRGDDLWTLASAHTPTGGNVQDVVDRVITDNKLGGAALQPGQRLRIPK